MNTITFGPADTGVVGFVLDDLRGGRTAVLDSYESALAAQRAGDYGGWHILPVTAPDTDHGAPEMTLGRRRGLALLRTLGIATTPGRAAPEKVRAAADDAGLNCPRLGAVIDWCQDHGREVQWG